MRQQTRASKEPAEKVVQDIRRATRKHYSAEEKIRIVLEGLRGEDSIAELCRREGIAQNLYYRWSKDFLEAGKKRLAGDTARAATSDEVHDLRREATALKEVVADLTLENRLLTLLRVGSLERGPIGDYRGTGSPSPAGSISRLSACCNRFSSSAFSHLATAMVAIPLPIRLVGVRPSRQQSMHAED